jgi:hypothetical protein
VHLVRCAIQYLTQFASESHQFFASILKMRAMESKLACARELRVRSCINVPLHPFLSPRSLFLAGESPHQCKTWPFARLGGGVFVTLSHVNNAEVTVDFQTADDSATADSDYEEKSGTLFPLDGGTRGGSRNGPILAFVI